MSSFVEPEALVCSVLQEPHCCKRRFAATVCLLAWQTLNRPLILASLWASLFGVSCPYTTLVVTNGLTATAAVKATERVVTADALSA